MKLLSKISAAAEFIKNKSKSKIMQYLLPIIK